MTTNEWTGGLPRSGVGLSNDNRMTEHNKFAVEILGEVVTIREGSKVVRYTRASYRPVLDKLGPEINVAMDESEKFQGYQQIANLGVVLGSGMAASGANKSPQQIVGALVAVGAFLARFFYGGKADEQSLKATQTYRDRLDHLVFPPTREGAARRATDIPLVTFDWPLRK